ncbi:MAG: hypothetical protein JHC38_04110, partial [Thiotrichales bacterium]|nr:hypothetical protein [Thiotrichales bacterium]
MKTTVRYSKDWVSSIGTDPFKIFGIVWFDKCASLVKVTSDSVKAFDLGILAARFDEIWYLRRIEYMNEHGDFNFTLTPAEILTNEILIRQEIGHFGDF